MVVEEYCSGRNPAIMFAIFLRNWECPVDVSYIRFLGAARKHFDILTCSLSMQTKLEFSDWMLWKLSQSASPHRISKILRTARIGFDERATVLIV